MGRTTGSRNERYDERRRKLIRLARSRLVQPSGTRASLREIAQACGVTMPTMRHYFPLREDLILAVMAENLAQGEPHLSHIAEPRGLFAESVLEAIAYAAFGFEHGLGEVHTLGLTEGLRHSTLGPAFINLVLEPSLDALAKRLDAHVATGEMREVDTKSAALSLLAPVILLMLHQRELGGEREKPISVENFIKEHAAGFVRGFANLASAHP